MVIFIVNQEVTFLTSRIWIKNINNIIFMLQALYHRKETTWKNVMMQPKMQML